MYKISIIIPVFNVKKYLDKCIKSVLVQSLKEIEVIIIDDGSTDGSDIICDKYARQDQRITLIHRENDGVQSARNLGISIAKGEYLAFIDSDDWIEEKYCEILYQEAVKNAYPDIVVADYFVDRKGKSTIRHHYCIKSFFTKDKEELKTIQLHTIVPRAFQVNKRIKNNYRIASPWARIYKKEVISNNHLQFNPLCKSHDDIVFNFEYMKYAKKFCYINSPIYHYNLNNMSITKKFNPLITKENRLFYDEIKHLQDFSGNMQALYSLRMLCLCENYKRMFSGIPNRNNINKILLDNERLEISKLQYKFCVNRMSRLLFWMFKARLI